MNRACRILLLCQIIGLAQAPPQSITAAIRAKHYDEAVELAGQALKTAPGDATLLTLLGIALHESGRDQPALAAFMAALNATPDAVAALQGASQIEYTAASDRAVPLLDHLLKLRPADPTVHAMRGVMAWNQNDCPAAIIHFEQSRDVIAKQKDAMREYGICLARMEQPKAAAEVFEQIVAADASDRSARRSLAAVRITAQQYQAALDALKPLIEPPTEADALALASIAYEALGDTPNAVAALRQAIVLTPRTVKYYVAFAELSFAHKSFEAGIRMLDAGLVLSPASPELHLARGILYVQIGRIEEADADFAASEKLAPGEAGAAAVRVLERLQQGNVAEALQQVEEQMKQRPNDAFLYYVLAETLNWQGPQPGSAEFRKALEAARKAVELQPSLVLARNLLSRLYLDSGEVKLGIDQCRAVLRDNPYDPVALYRLMRALKMTGNPGDASEVPELLKRFNEARRLAGEQEARQNRYKLVENSR